MLGSYFCTTKNEVVAEHLGSLNLPTVKSETVFKAVVGLINEKELPWCNLMAVLMDSCSVMRGSTKGFEIKLCESVTPALIDMDGDSCHYIHNACKKFTKILEVIYKYKIQVFRTALPRYL